MQIFGKTLYKTRLPRRYEKITFKFGNILPLLLIINLMSNKFDIIFHFMKNIYW